MLIKKIKLDNIRSYSKQEIELPKGSVLLSGNIGSGKTTVLLAIEFALFGLQRGLVDGASLLRNGQDSGSVELEIELDGKKIKLIRTLKRKKDSVTQDKSSLIMDGQEKELSAEELKAFVLNTLNYPRELLKKQNLIYRYTVYTPQEHMKKIISEPEDRQDIIRRIFNIDKYKRIQDSCELFTTRLKEISKLKQGQISDLPFKKQELEKKKTNYTETDSKIKEIMPNYDKIQKEIKEIKQKNESLKEKSQEFNLLKQELTKIDTELNEKYNNFNDDNKILSQINKTIKQLRFELENASEIDSEIISKRKESEKTLEDKRKQELQIEREISGQKSQKERWEQDIKKISKLSICPMCKQNVSEEHRTKMNDEFKQEIEKINASLNEKDGKIGGIKKEIAELDKILGELREKEKLVGIIKIKKENLNQKEKESEELDKKIYETAKQIDSLQKKGAEVKEKVEGMINIEKEIREIEKEIDKKLNEEKEIIKLKASFEKGRVDLEREIKEIEQELKEKERIMESIDKISELKDWLSKQFILVMQQIEKQVMLKLNLEFNLLFKRWFSVLVEDALDARIDLEFSPIIEQAGYDMDYSYLSGGERTALALAYRLALNQVINSMLSRLSTKSILILDEPTDGFSSEQLDRMRQVLDDINVEQLILVSHESKIENFVDNVINFSKDNNTTIVK